LAGIHSILAKISQIPAKICCNGRLAASHKNMFYNMFGSYLAYCSWQNGKHLLFLWRVSEIKLYQTAGVTLCEFRRKCMEEKEYYQH